MRKSTTEKIPNSNEKTNLQAGDQESWDFEMEEDNIEEDDNLSEIEEDDIGSSQPTTVVDSHPVRRSERSVRRPEWTRDYVM